MVLFDGTTVEAFGFWYIYVSGDTSGFDSLFALASKTHGVRCLHMVDSVV